MADTTTRMSPPPLGAFASSYAGRDPAAIPITAFNPPAAPDTLKRYRDAGLERVIFSIASEDRDKTLATLDKLAAVMRQAG